MNDRSSPRPRHRFLLLQALTLARIPLALGFAVVLLAFDRSAALLVLGVILLAVIEVSDLLDGYLARRLGVVSEWGAMLDPYADSVSRIIVYWTLACGGLVLAVVPLAMALRDVTVAYCRIVWTRHGRSVSARWSGKIKAVVQGTAAFFLLIGPHTSLWPPWATATASWIVLIVTLGSAIEYIAKTIATARPTDSAR